MVALLFPGQGSQYVGMGRDLAQAYPEVRRMFEEADDVLGFPLSRLAWEGPDALLTSTENAQPAILTHSLAVFRLLADRIGNVACAAGHSLGEFSAYVAAGSFSFAHGLAVVRRRGELMRQSADERPGAMAAVLRLDDEIVEQVCRDASAEGGACVPANYNSPGELVISGDEPAIERAIVLARAAGARRALRLKVSGAFHSPLMASAEPGLAETLAELPMSAPRFPVVSNVTAQPVFDPAEARRLLVRQLTAPVQWTQSVRGMLEQSVTRFVEVGPGTVLTGLLRRIERSAACRSVGTTADMEGVWDG